MSQANDPLKERVVFCSSDGLYIDVKTEAVKVFGYGCVSKNMSCWVIRRLRFKKRVLLDHSLPAVRGDVKLQGLGAIK